MKWQFRFDLEIVYPRMTGAVGKAFSILGQLWAWVHGVKLDLFLFHYAEKYYMLICCTIKLLLAHVYESPLLCSNNVTNKLLWVIWNHSSVKNSVFAAYSWGGMLLKFYSPLKPLLKLFHLTSLTQQTYWISFAVWRKH